MPELLIWQLLLQLVLIALNAIFACAEIAAISINDNKLEHLAKTGDKRAKRLLSLTSQPAKFLATIQVGITFAGFLGSAFAADSFSKYLVDFLVSTGVAIPPASLNAISVVIITIILAYFTLVFGELVPKRIGMKKAEAIGLSMSGLVYFVSKIFSPAVWLLTISTNSILRLIGIDPNTNDDKVTEEEIRLMVDAGSQAGAIDLDEKEYIQNIFELDDITANEVMTHRIDVSLLWMEEDDEEWKKIIVETRHAMYPICENSPDNIVGVLNTKDYFRLEDKSRGSVMKKAVKPAQFVPETVRADVLFRNMKQSRSHFMVVLDEYGGMSGIVTISDLLEQLVGDLENEISEVEPPQIEELDSHRWIISGAAPLDEVAESIGIPLPCDEYDTFSGMVFGMLGKVPKDGSRPELDAFGLSIKVIEIRDHRLEKAIVTLSEKKEAESD
jgi:Hemolysins and related proteins containing CBS domains